MPRLWAESIEAHRRDVADAVLDATARLAAERGPLTLTMSQVADAAGIGRATLYKYFPSLEAVLTAWHRREVTTHLTELHEVQERHSGGVDALEALLTAYARIVRENPPARAPLLHADEHIGHARSHLLDVIVAAVEDGVRDGAVRDDVPSRELAAFCIHAVEAAADVPSPGAVNRLVTLTLGAVRPAS
jgi:AcrR family transcriptional regulator